MLIVNENVYNVLILVSMVSVVKINLFAMTAGLNAVINVHFVKDILLGLLKTSFQKKNHHLLFYKKD
jgi:hypothetical protein|tara:strand:- start:235 stop:435 length:201 start_codon:yes stop_codon:yes gene_type:complete